jgi:hypothetical protein
MTHNEHDEHPPSQDILMLGEHKLSRERIRFEDRYEKLTINERRQSAYLWMEILRFSIAGILTLSAIIVGLLIFFITDDADAKTWALSLMQAAFFAGIGYSFGSATGNSTSTRVGE